MIFGALPIGSFGKSSGFGVFPRNLARRASGLAMRFMPTTPPTPINVKPRPISIGSNPSMNTTAMNEYLPAPVVRKPSALKSNLSTNSSARAPVYCCLASS